MVTRGKGWSEGELNEGRQKVQTFSDKIHNCCMLYMRVDKRVDPKCFHHNNFFSISLILFLYEMMDGH